MSGFGKKSTAYICYLLVNFWWYVPCVLGIAMPLLLLYDYLEDSHPDTIFGITAPISTSLIALKQPEQYDFISIGSIEGMVDFGYILQHSPSTYLLWAIFVCFMIGIYLIGLYQLRSLLHSTVYKKVFSKKNVRRIKIIAVLILLLKPLALIQQYFIFESLGSFVPQGGSGFQVGLPGPAIGPIFIGLLIYSLGAVFEKGYELYQEQKLTV